MLGTKKKVVTGWGKYPTEECNIYRPETLQDSVSILESNQYKNYIARGLGRSYGDTALNKEGALVLQTKYSRYINFNEATGVLECEAGVTFEDIIDVFLPKGYFLPVTPGTKYVTLGGAIANDVHGKNHHKDGCISDHIIDFKLLTASGRILTCSRDENEDLFWATIGGIGLTGIIISAKIKLIPVESAYINVDYHKANNLDIALEQFESTDDKYQYSVAWIDCLASGKSLGRSVLMRGNHALKNEISSGKDPLIIKKKPKMNVPVNFPSFSLNQLTIGLFNSVYYSSFKDGSNKVVDYDSFFYPLDSVLNWNRMYGKKGFIQYQVVFPPKTSREGLIAILNILSSSKRSSFLAVLKSFGNQNRGLLSFPTKGYTLALDIPIKDNSIFPFIRKLDEAVLKYNGRLYLAKDSCMDDEMFKMMYPSILKFEEIKRKVDPNGIFSSSMAKRLRIMEEV